MIPLVATDSASLLVIVVFLICLLLGFVRASHACGERLLGFHLADAGEGNSGAAIAAFFVCDFPIFLLFNQAGLFSASKSASASASLHYGKNSWGGQTEGNLPFSLLKRMSRPQSHYKAGISKSRTGRLTWASAAAAPNLSGPGAGLWVKVSAAKDRPIRASIV